MEKPKAALRGRYAVQNLAVCGALRCADAVLSLLPVRCRAGTAPEAPRRILVSNIAHLGDAVVATAVLPVLHSAYPEAQIGFLVGGWARSILDGHPLVEWIHTLDHWMLSRAAISRSEKIRRYRQSRARALREIRAVGYDVAIDLYANVPNTLTLLWQAGIPRRIAYTSAGCGALATERLELELRGQHIGERHLDLLRRLPVSDADAARLAPVLPPVAPDAGARVVQELQTAGLDSSRYVLMHMGSGSSVKDWPAENWQALAGRLSTEGYSLLFTGAGPRDRALIESVTPRIRRALSLCDRLDWPALVAAVQSARLVVCVDTVAGHIAGAVGTPCVVIMAGLCPYLWSPLSRQCVVLWEPVPCSPCHRSHGCEEMECIRGVTVSRVHEAMCRMLTAPCPDAVDWWWTTVPS